MPCVTQLMQQNKNKIKSKQTQINSSQGISGCKNTVNQTTTIKKTRSDKDGHRLLGLWLYCGDKRLRWSQGAGATED